MASTPLIPVQETILSQDDDTLYEVVDDQKVELPPMGAYSVVARSSPGDASGKFCQAAPTGQSRPGDAV